MTYPPGFTIYASSPADQESIASAKSWISGQNYTSDDISLRKTDKIVYVVTKRDLELA